MRIAIGLPTLLVAALLAVGCQNDPKDGKDKKDASAKDVVADKDQPGKDDAPKDQPRKDEPKKDEPKKDDAKKDQPPKDQPKKDDTKKDDARKPGPLELTPPTDAEVAALVKAQNDLAFAVYGKLAEKPGNIAFSPFAAGAGLLTASLSARGDTAAALARAAHPGLTPARAAAAWQALRPPEAEPAGPARFFGCKLEGNKGDGFKVADVAADSPADKARLKAGDVLLEIDGKPLKTGADLVNALDRTPGPVPVKVRVKATGKEEERVVQLAAPEKPAPGRKAWVELRAAAALLFKKGTTVDPAFAEAARQAFGADARAVDFADTAAVKAVNAWAAERTGGVAELLAAVPADKTTGLLAAAASVKAPFATQFPNGNTKDAPFAVAGKDVSVPTMGQQARLQYYKGKDFQVVELPVKGMEHSFLLVVPDAKDGLAALEKGLTAAAVEEWIKGFKTVDGKLPMVDLFLPRVALDGALDLKDALTAAGVPLFAAEADLSGVTGQAKGPGLSGAPQRAPVKFEEGGLGAGLAGPVLIDKSRPDVEVRADRPFLFLLRNTKTGQVLLLGRVADPKAP
jgi:serpin B